MNNVDLEKMKAFAEEVQQNPSKAKKTKQIEGIWNFDEDKAQFSSTLKFPNGEAVIEAEMPPFMGGKGRSPDPIQYCLYGLASCYTATFVSIAAEAGVKLQEVKVTASNQQNLLRPMGLSDDPPVEGVNLSLNVKSNASEEKIQELEKLANERCPGVYCLRNPIELNTNIKFD